MTRRHLFRSQQTRSRLTTTLRQEPLEERLPLTADLAFAAPLAADAINEGETLDVSFQFTDSVTSSPGESVGLNPGDFASLGVFDPTDPVADIVFDTDALTVTGFTGTGSTVSADVGFGAYEIAVFAFDSFDLDDGQTITATGSRPLAILSQSDLTVGGVIDASAPGDALGSGFGSFAGPGGGAGGVPRPDLPPQPLTGESIIPTDGENAPGAPTTGVFIGAGESEPIESFSPDFGGGGGGFGGDGGFNPSPGPPIPTVNGGVAYGDLSIAIQGGSGGGAGRDFISSGFIPVFEGGGGGGGIELGAVGAVTVMSTGAVLADGSNGEMTSSQSSGGGGAGGGILLHAFDVTVNGLLSADGGDATTTNDISQSGGGGGGRILLAHDQSGVFDTAGSTISVAGGLSGQNDATAATDTPSFGTIGQDGVFEVVATASETSIDDYTFAVDLLDAAGGILSSLASGDVLDVVLNAAGDGILGTVALTGLDDTLFGDDAALQVRVTVSDGTNDAVDRFDLSVLNLDPTVGADVSAVSGVEGDTLAATGVFDDVPADTVTLTASIGTVAPATGGTWSWSFDAEDDFAGVVTITATDDDGGSASVDFDLTVANADPTIGSVTTTSSALGGARAGETVTLNADFSDAGVLDTHTAEIDWGDGTVTIATVDSATGTLTGDHVYASGGLFDVTVTLVDDDGGTDDASANTVIAGVGVQDGVLVGVGTNGDDSFKVFKSFFSGDLRVRFRLDGGSSGWVRIDEPVDQIDLLLGGGEDVGFVSGSVRVDAYIDAGDGDDLLVGGSGDDILLGGAGYDLMFGRGGRDLTIGGTGGDLIFGDGGQDILISGTTSHDSSRAALDLIMAEWTSDRSYAERVDNLRGDLDLSGDGLNDEIFLIAGGEDQTVFDDESVDWLIGGRGRDLYFAGEDDISLARFNEVVDEIEAEAPTS